MTTLLRFSVLLLFFCSSFTMSFAQAEAAETAAVEETVYEVYEPKTKKWKASKLDKNPEANGGDENFWNIVNSQMMYPDRAQRAKIEGDVVLTMTVSERGELIELKVKQELGAGCDEEAFNAIRIASTNRFIPGMIDGKPVRTRYDVSINFSLQ